MEAEQVTSKRNVRRSSTSQTLYDNYLIIILSPCCSFQGWQWSQLCSRWWCTGSRGCAARSTPSASPSLSPYWCSTSPLLVVRIEFTFYDFFLSSWSEQIRSLLMFCRFQLLVFYLASSIIMFWVIHRCFENRQLLTSMSFYLITVLNRKRFSNSYFLQHFLQIILN